MSKIINGIEIYNTNETGLITNGRFLASVPTTANTFAAGCILQGCDGKVYTNAGTSAAPSFQDINSISTSEIADGAITNAKVDAAAAIAISKLATIGAGKIIVGAVTTGTPTAVDMSGDATIDNVGALTVANGAITKAKTASGVLGSHNIVAVNAAKTTNLEENVGIYDSVIVLANALKGTMNVHYADFGATGEEHKAQDAAIAAANATDLASCVTLTKAIQDSYVAHNADSILASDWVYHQAQGTNRALVSAVNPTLASQCLTVLNDIKAKLNLHMADAASHTAGDSPAEAAADAAASAVSSMTISGANTGDFVFYNVLDDGTNNVSIVSAVAGPESVVVTFSADPVADTVISLLLVRTIV
jgi:hypothetical protein